MKHPVSGEQLTFERREYRADPIERPEHHPGDSWVGIVCAAAIVGAIVALILDRL